MKGRFVRAALIVFFILMLIALSLSIAVFGFSRRGNGSMTRLKGALWLLAFLAYAGVMIVQELQQAS